jgi:hypothetical protein
MSRKKGKGRREMEEIADCGLQIVNWKGER